MRFLLLIIFTGCFGFGYGQNSHELDKRNGFKDIKLLANVSTYPGLEFSKEIKEKPEHAIYINKKGNYENIGEVKISKLIIYTYRNLIYEIEVITDKNEKLYRSLEKAYGKIKYSVGSQVSYWEGNNVRLNYRSESAKRIKLSYHAKGINKIIATDKKKAVDSLATEF